MKTRFSSILLMAAIAGSLILSDRQFACAEKIEPGVVARDGENGNAPDHTARATVENMTEWYEAVGTIRPRTESRVSAQVTAQVVDVRVRPGDRVQKGTVMIVLDGRQFLSRVDQAKHGLKAAAAGEKRSRQAVVSAVAAFKQAKAQYDRIKTYYRSQAATRKDLEQAESAYRQAEAAVHQARQALAGADAGIRQSEEIVHEAGISLDYTKILAPEQGEVLERLVEPGDMALPGKALLVLRTSGALRIEASVREGLIQKVSVGARLPVTLATLGRTVDAVVEEVVPYADPRTRTFLVKASLPVMDGLFPGMFGKLLIPVQEISVVTIPAVAVRHVGQLELVSLKEGQSWKSVYIRTGKVIKDKIEVLSGLAGDETIGWED